MRWLRSKSSGERKRYTINWSDWLDTGEAVQAVAFAVLNNTTDDPLVVDGDMLLPDAAGVQYYVSGGELNSQYEVLVTMTTNQDQVREDTVFFSIKEP